MQSCTRRVVADGCFRIHEQHYQLVRWSPGNRVVKVFECLLTATARDELPTQRLRSGLLLDRAEKCIHASS